MIRILALAMLLFQPLGYAQTVPAKGRLRVGIAGLTHGHVHWILRSAKQGTIQLAGIWEPNRDLAQRLMKQYDLDGSLWFAGLDEMLVKAKPEAVAAFGSIFDHLAVVKACAPRKVHVMVEKPLAVNLDHAKQMEALAKQNNIHLLTNYETTWYGSNHRAWKMLHEERLFGNIIKMVVHDGHQGPKEIGVNSEFLEWLADPKLNGGGALMDFGCYGANLVTWLMQGQRPTSVFAVTQQIKPDIYPKVDDEATIVVTYPKAQAIIQASWNWPYSRKDMDIYGQTGYISADKNGVRYMTSTGRTEQKLEVPFRDAPYNDPFLFLSAVVRNEIAMQDNDLSSLAINMIAMEILQAATESARTGKVVKIKP